MPSCFFFVALISLLNALCSRISPSSISEIRSQLFALCYSCAPKFLCTPTQQHASKSKPSKDQPSTGQLVEPLSASQLIRAALDRPTFVGQLAKPLTNQPVGRIWAHRMHMHTRMCTCNVCSHTSFSMYASPCYVCVPYTPCIQRTCNVCSILHLIVFHTWLCVHMYTRMRSYKCYYVPNLLDEAGLGLFLLFLQPTRPHGCGGSGAPCSARLWPQKGGRWPLRRAPCKVWWPPVGFSLHQPLLSSTVACAGQSVGGTPRLRITVRTHAPHRMSKSVLSCDGAHRC